ncbi:hypothetical protein [Falsiroseomonas oryzae]|uniref:hypothetical protein n=1 Tax=Falsiroseomonas oryzae TaxID=2766473 RepID=UPI0022EB44F8|nr:hypothetical protein [Roseomonas sp. MO-31]
MTTDLHDVRRGAFLVALDQLAPASPETDAAIAAVLGSRVAAEMRRGDVLLPLDSVPALAFALGLDPALLVRLWLDDYGIVGGDDDPGRSHAEQHTAPVGPWVPAVPVTPWGTELHGLDPNRSNVLSHRFREGTLLAIARVAKERGLTQKQLIARALLEAGVPVMEADLEDRTPVRRRRDEV